MDGAWIASVADGHGGARYFRSERGARLATQVAVKVLKNVLAAGPDELPHRLQGQVPRDLVKEWRRAVAADLLENGFTQPEVDALAEKLKIGVDDLLLEPLLAYGTTLLVVLATEEFVFYLQLGDGDILTVFEDGSVSRPFARDPRLVANATTSLCMRDAVKHMKVRIHHAAPQLPALVMVSTDGYSDSYATEEEFLRLGADYMRIIQDDGFDSVGRSLEGWLSEVTAGASGDDITLALLFRPSALAPQRPVGLRKNEPKAINRDGFTQHSRSDIAEAQHDSLALQAKTAGNKAPQGRFMPSGRDDGIREAAEQDIGASKVRTPDLSGATITTDVHLQPSTEREDRKENAPVSGPSTPADEQASGIEADLTSVDVTGASSTTVHSPNAPLSYPPRRLFVGLYEDHSKWKPRLPWWLNNDE
jgi:hypothetical protein